jgi:hypothetical protein
VKKLTHTENLTSENLNNNFVPISFHPEKKSLRVQRYSHRKEQDGSEKDFNLNQISRKCLSARVADPDPPDPHALGLLDPDPDPLVRGMDPDPSII